MLKIEGAYTVLEEREGQKRGRCIHRAIYYEGLVL
jgi:hypothetical protein